jgi:hypothetical protein
MDLSISPRRLSLVKRSSIVFATHSAESPKHSADGGPGNSPLSDFPALSFYRAIFRSIRESVRDTYVFHTRSLYPEVSVRFSSWGTYTHGLFLQFLREDGVTQTSSHQGCALYFSSQRTARPKNNNPKVRRWPWNACAASQQDLFPLKSLPALALSVLTHLGHLDSVTGQKLPFQTSL